MNLNVNKNTLFLQIFVLKKEKIKNKSIRDNFCTLSLSFTWFCLMDKKKSCYHCPNADWLKRCRLVPIPILIYKEIILFLYFRRCSSPSQISHIPPGWSIVTVKSNHTLRTEKISLSLKAKLFFQPQQMEFWISSFQKIL